MCLHCPDRAYVIFVPIHNYYAVFLPKTNIDKQKPYMVGVSKHNITKYNIK